MLSTHSPRHVVILPYYCPAEIERYLKLSDWMIANCKTPLDCTFLLAASPKTEKSAELASAFARVAPVVSFQCPTQIFGYPAGPTAMFWDAMDFIANHFSGDGFSFWLESDMAPIKADWVERLSAQWFSGGGPPLVMGCYVPHVYRFRWFRRPKLLLTPHINGGACYAIDFARRMPVEAREGVFDMSVFRFGQAVGELRPSKQIAFSTLQRARRDLLSPEKCVLHGFMQDKDRFIEECVRPLSQSELNSRLLAPLSERIEQLQRQMRVLFVRHGQRAMLENMLLAKQRVEGQI